MDFVISLTFRDTSRIKGRVGAGLNSFLNSVYVSTTLIANVCPLCSFAEPMVSSEPFVRRIKDIEFEQN